MNRLGPGPSSRVRMDDGALTGRGLAGREARSARHSRVEGPLRWRGPSGPDVCRVRHCGIGRPHSVQPNRCTPSTSGQCCLRGGPRGLTPAAQDHDDGGSRCGERTPLREGHPQTVEVPKGARSDRHLGRAPCGVEAHRRTSAQPDLGWMLHPRVPQVPHSCERVGQEPLFLRAGDEPGSQTHWANECAMPARSSSQQDPAGAHGPPCGRRTQGHRHALLVGSVAGEVPHGLPPRNRTPCPYPYIGA